MSGNSKEVNYAYSERSYKLSQQLT